MFYQRAFLFSETVLRIQRLKVSLRGESSWTGHYCFFFPLVSTTDVDCPFMGLTEEALLPAYAAPLRRLRDILEMLPEADLLM